MNDKQPPPPPPPPQPDPAASAGAAKALGKRPWSKPTIRNSNGVIDSSAGQDPNVMGEYGAFYRSP